MPMMAHILANHHGFECNVLFAINRKTGVMIPTKETISRDFIFSPTPTSWLSTQDLELWLMIRCK